MKMRFFTEAMAVITLLAVPVAAKADAVAAYDDATDAAYSDGWQTGDNGGSGWGGTWNLFNSSPAGQFVGTSQDNGFGDGNIDTGGLSLGMFANSSGSANASRAFNGTLGIGQSVIVHMDNGFVDSGSSVGFTLTGFGDPMSTEQLSFFFRGGESNYRISNGQFVFLTEHDTGVGFTSAGLQIVFTLVDADSYALAITPNGGSTTTLNGDFLIPAAFDHIELHNYNAGSGSANDVFFNSIQVIPEPATAGLMLLGVAGLLGLRRKK